MIFTSDLHVRIQMARETLRNSGIDLGRKKAKLLLIDYGIEVIVNLKYLMEVTETARDMATYPKMAMKIRLVSTYIVSCF